MSSATLGQGQLVLHLIESLGLDSEELQALIASGFLSDLLKAAKTNRLGKVNRGRLYATLQLPIPRPAFEYSVEPLGEFDMQNDTRPEVLVDGGRYFECPEDWRQKYSFQYHAGRRNLYVFRPRGRVSPKDLMTAISFIPDKQIATPAELLLYGADARSNAPGQSGCLVCLAMPFKSRKKNQFLSFLRDSITTPGKTKRCLCYVPQPSETWDSDIYSFLLTGTR